MKRHKLKTWPTYFQAILEGKKTFEVRRDDRGFAVGDELILREFDQIEGDYTGRSLTVTASYVLRGIQSPGFGVDTGFVVVGFAGPEVERLTEALKARGQLAKVLGLMNNCGGPANRTPARTDAPEGSWVCWPEWEQEIKDAVHAAYAALAGGAR